MSFRTKKTFWRMIKIHDLIKALTFTTSNFLTRYMTLINAAENWVGMVFDNGMNWIYGTKNRSSLADSDISRK